MTYEYEQYLAHHGVKGQKWGTRRFQNEDGTLTEEGKKRYYKDTGFARNVLGGDFGLRAAANANQEQFEARAHNAKRSGDKANAKKYREYAEAQRKASADMKAYRAKTSTAKLITQNLLLSPVGGHVYRQARARGSGFISSVLQGGSGMIGYGVGLYKNKKKYGRVAV